MAKLHCRFAVSFAVLLVALATAGCTKELRKSSHLSRGNTAFAAQKYDTAEIEYLKVLQVAPLDPTAFRQLGIIYEEQGRLLRAAGYLRKANELEPNNVQTRVKLSLVYLGLKFNKEAAEEANWVLTKVPGQEEALLVLAASPTTLKGSQDTQAQIEKMLSTDKEKSSYHAALGTLFLVRSDSTNAETQFKKALDLDPKSAPALVGSANVNWLRGNLPEAERAFKSAAEVSPPRSPWRIKYAEFKLRTQGVEEAKKLLEEITQQAPDFLPAWNLLAQVALAQKKYDDCYTFLQRILARDPNNSDALTLSGNLKLSKGDIPAAVIDFERLALAYPKSPQAHYLLARAYVMNRNTVKASASLGQALVLAPDFADATVLLAELNIRKGDYPPAVISLTKLVKQHPENAQAHLLLASAYAAQKNFDAAIGVYHQMMPLFPKSPQVPCLMGVLLMQQTNLPAARQAADQALERSPDYFPALELLVDLNLAEKQEAAAADLVQKQIQANPERADLRLLLAKVNIAQHKLELAEQALVKAIELAPDSRPAFLMLSQVYAASGKQQQALERLNSFLAKTNDVRLLMQVGMLQESQTNYTAARDAYEKLLAIDPQFGAALNNLAFLYMEHFGNPDKALQLAEKARQLFPKDPSVADTLGWILYRRGEYPRALTLVQESADKAPDEPEIQFHLGMTHYMLGEEAPAQAALQRSLQGKDFSGKEQATNCLAILAINNQNPDATARAQLEKAVKANPDDPVALARLGAIQEREGAFDKAAETYRTALKRNPRNAQLMLKLARLYSAPPLNDPQKALAMAKDAHDASPDDPTISALLGRLVYQSGDQKWAASLLEDSARRLPNDPSLSFDLAWAYYSIGRVSDAQAAMQVAVQAGSSYAKAEEAERFMRALSAAKDPAQVGQMAPEVQKWLAADPIYLPGLMLSALSQEGQGNYKDAARVYDQILARYPLFTPATRNLGLLYFTHLGDDQKAYDLCTKARESFPQDPDIAKALGVLTYRKGNYARASQLLKESALSRKGDAELLYYLGMAQYQLKSKAESKASLQQAVALNLQAKMADDAKRILAELK